MVSFINSFLSKVQAQSHLDVAIAGLALDAAERRACGGHGRITPIRMIEHIEGLAAQLESQLLHYSEVLAQREIRKRRSRSANDTSAPVPERSRGRQREDGRIEPEVLIGIRNRE